MSWNLSTKLLLLCTTIIVTCPAKVHGKADVLYVKSEDGSPCPEGVQCQTLNWYCNSHNFNASFKSNVKMVFLEGHHSLETFITVVQHHNFTMTGQESASADGDGQPQPASWINCSSDSVNGTGLVFINSSEIHISNLGFDSCSGNVKLNPDFIAYFAVGFLNVSNLSLNFVVINNTIGFGLQCENVLGQININTSVFKNAKGDGLVYGGNARFWFGTQCPHKLTNSSVVKVTITNSWFMYGKEISTKYYNASGIQVHLNCPNICMVFNNITAYGNRGVNGGNLAISVIDHGSSISNITINNSNISSGTAVKGGGIRFWSQIDASSDRNRHLSHGLNKNILHISNTIFSNNCVESKKSMGGAIYIAHYEAENYTGQLLRRIIIQNCSFVGNSGNGAVMELLKQTIPGYIQHFTPQLSVYIDSCVFDKNMVPATSHQLSSIVDMIGMKNITLSNSNFTNSTGTVISLQNSNLNFLGKVRFENNNAVYGGGLKVCDRSFLYVYNGTNVLFINNKASKKGGAIYVQHGCLDTPPACFFQPAVSQSVPIEDFEELFNVTFVNNSASLAGDAIYGGSINFCFTFKAFSYNGSKSVYNLKQYFAKLLNTSGQSGHSVISSDPQGTCICSLKGRCAKENCLNLTKYPGQTFSVSVSSVGQFNGTTTGVITANLTNGHTDDELKSKNSTSVYQGCVTLSYKVHTKRIEEKHITFASLSTDVIAYNNICNASLLLNLQPCPLGFELSEKGCCCNSLLTKQDAVVCDIDTQLIHIHTNNPLWVGYYEKLEDDAENKTQLMVNWYCNIDCCSNNNHTINISNKTSFDDQCLPGRTGTLCGACQPGLSRILGSFTKCKQCTNINVFFMIPTILLSGLALVLLLAVLNITVTEGTLYALIIYANAIYNSPDFSHGNDLHKFMKFIAWLNLDIGFELCFYNGMNGYQKIWLIYGYLFYLLAIQGIIIYLCRRFMFFTRLFGRNIVKVLATLIFLMQSPLIYAILQTFQGTYIHISAPNDTSKRLVWLFDGNVPFYGPKHMPLFIVGVLCTCLMTLFMLSLLTIQCLQRRSNLFCFRWVEKLRPFFEAYTGPCRDYYRFWPGFLMFMRAVVDLLNVLVVTYYLSSSQRNLIYVGIAAVCVIILSLSCTFPRGVYKKWPLNMLEFSIFLNLLVSSVLWSSSVKTSENVYTSTGIAMLTFLGILIYHIVVKITKLSVFKRLKIKPRLSKLARKIPFKQQFGHCTCCLKESSDPDETTPLLAKPLPPVIQYEQYRELLIAETSNEA